MELSIPFANSLKAKRQVLRRVIDRVRAKFNAAVAEVGSNDAWQQAVVAVVVVGNGRRHVDAMLGSIFRFAEGLSVAPITGWSTELVPMGHEAFDTAFVSEEENEETS